MNKPHKHAELIKAWADGKTIEYLDTGLNKWTEMSKDSFWWDNTNQYRIKPEPKPDSKTVLVRTGLGWEEHAALHWCGTWLEGFEIIRDGETGELKSAEVLK